VLACGLPLIALDRMRLRRLRSAAGLLLFAVAVLVFDRAGADELIDQNQRAQMLKHGDGRIAHLETEYNDLFIDKHGSELGLSSRYGCVAGEVPFRLSRRRSRRKARYQTLCQRRRRPDR
jgi:hypothetical protein